jgi:hypothetical protein
VNTDNITSISGAVAIIFTGIAVFFPQEYGVGIKQIGVGLALIAGLIFAHYTNKMGVPSPPPDPAKVKALADQLQAMVDQLKKSIP